MYPFCLMIKVYKQKEKCIDESLLNYPKVMIIIINNNETRREEK